MSDFITNSDIDTMEGEELSVRVGEASGALVVPPGSDWRHVHPRWWRDRLRRYLFEPGPGQFVYCAEYHKSLDDALSAGDIVGAEIPADEEDPTAVCRLVLKHKLATK